MGERDDGSRDWWSLPVEELRARNRASAIASLRACHIDLKLRRPDKKTAQSRWDDEVSFLRGRLQHWSPKEVDDMVAEATAAPITMAETHPELHRQMRREAEAKANRTPEQRRKDRRYAIIFSTILGLFVCLGVYVTVHKPEPAEPCSVEGDLTGVACDEPRDNDLDYYPGMEICDVPPAAWGEPITCERIP